MLEVGFSAICATMCLPATDATEDAASVVALKTLRRDFISILAAAQLTTMKSFAISTPFTALMLISAWAYRIQSVKYTGSPSPAGAARHHRHFRADESPSFSARASSSSSVKFVPHPGQKNGLSST